MPGLIFYPEFTLEKAEELKAPNLQEKSPEAQSDFQMARVLGI